MFSPRLILLSTALAAVVPPVAHRSAHAEPSPRRASSKAPAALIQYEHRTADRVTPLPGSARPFAEAKVQLARGEPALALRTLSKAGRGLLQDRNALLRADALLALGRKRRAEAAYLEAIEYARVESVALLAARGLVETYAQLGDRKRELAFIDALLTVRRISRRPNLMLRRATVLRRLRRLDAASREAWKIVRDFPTSRAARDAEKLLGDLEKRGVPSPASTTRLELARIRSLIASRAWKRAEAAIDELEKRRPELSRALEMKRAELFKRRRRRTEEQAVLTRLAATGMTEDDGPAILFRLGELAMNLDQNEQATARFDALAKKYPDSPEADKGAYLAGWIPYNDGQYAEATRRMLAFAEARPKSKRRTEALWWAGWSAYVGQDLGRARATFEQLIADHPTSTLVSHVRYWIGRIRQKSNQQELARDAYREILKSAPLSYYGFWAAARLEQLGEKTLLSPPPPAPPPTALREVLARLGPDRPTNIDRAIILHTAGLDAETREELTEAGRFLRKVRDTEGRTMVADMLVQLGEHHMAFRVGARIASDGAELERGEPWSWRAWRHAYPRAFDREVRAATQDHEVAPHLVWSIMRTESHYRPSARSRVGARGLMQLMPRTARLIGKKAKGGRRHAARFRNPDSNIWLGSWYLSALLQRFDGQLGLAAGSYNAGPKAVERWLETFDGRPLDEFVELIPYRETRRYVRRVIETVSIYGRLYGEPPLTLIQTVRNVPPRPDAVRF